MWRPHRFAMTVMFSFFDTGVLTKARRRSADQEQGRNQEAETGSLLQTKLFILSVWNSKNAEMDVRRMSSKA